jgi:hypothetical protein
MWCRWKFWETDWVSAVKTPPTQKKKKKNLAAMNTPSGYHTNCKPTTCMDTARWTLLLVVYNKTG